MRGVVGSTVDVVVQRGESTDSFDGSPLQAPHLRRDSPLYVPGLRLFYAGEVGIFEVTLLRTEVKKTDAYNNDLTELSGYLWKATSKGMMASVSMRKRWFTLKQNLMR